MYAMVLDKINSVVDIVNSNVPPEYPPLQDGTKIRAVECDENVKVNMIYSPETNSFIEQNFDPIQEEKA